MSSLPSTARLRRDGGELLPAAAVGIGGGLVAGVAPLAAAGLAISVILCLLPWNALFAVLSFASITQSAKTGGGGVSLNGINIAGLTVRPAMLAVIPFAIRAYLMTNPAVRNRWRAPEFMLLAYLSVITLSTFLYSPQVSKSIPTVGLIVFGLIAYYAVYAAMGTPERLRTATRIFLAVVLINAVYGIVALLARLALNTHFGVSANSDFGPGVYGLSYEHDIFASTCAAGAVTFFALWREQNRVIGPRVAAFGFFACSVAMLVGLARAAWIGYFVAMIALVFLTRRGVRTPTRFGRVGLVLLGAALVGVLASYVFVTTQTGTADQNNSVLGGVKSKLTLLFNVNTGTGRARASEFRTAAGDLPESPLIGLGANTFGMRHPQNRLKNNYIGDVWVRGLYESGIVGLALLAGAILLIVWPNRTLMSSRGPMASIARALTFGWIVLIIGYAGTDDTLYMWPWIALGLVRAARMLSEREYRFLRTARGTAIEAGGDEGVPALNGYGANGGPNGDRAPSGGPARRGRPRPGAGSS